MTLPRELYRPDGWRTLDLVLKGKELSRAAVMPIQYTGRVEGWCLRSEEAGGVDATVPLLWESASESRPHESMDLCVRMAQLMNRARGGTYDDPCFARHAGRVLLGDCTGDAGVYLRDGRIGRSFAARPLV